MFLIKIQSKSLGDTIAAMYVIEKFRLKVTPNEKIGVIGDKTEYYIRSYPEFVFYPLELEPIYNHIDGKWKISGDSYDDFQRIYYKLHEGLVEGIARQLGVTDHNIVDEFPTIDYYDPDAAIVEKTITFSMHSTAQLKFWNYPDGWRILIDLLKGEGYYLINIDYTPSYGNNGHWNEVPDNCTIKSGLSIEEASALINKSEFFIGISSGLSWLAHALHKPVVMISGMSKPECEFKKSILRIAGESECRGCFNNKNKPFDSNDWMWCPEYKDTPKQFICSKSITPEYVFEKIKSWISINMVSETDVKKITKGREKKVLVEFMSNSMGDYISALPYLDLYKKRESVDLYVKVTNKILIDLFRDSYPNIKFIGDSKGYTFDDTKVIKYFFNKNVQEGFANELGFNDWKFIKPKLLFEPKERPIKNKYVVINIHSTMQMKYWNHPGGKDVQIISPNWVELCRLIRKEGYTPVVVERDLQFGMPPYFNGAPKNANNKIGMNFDDVLNHIYHCEFFIGLSSGLTWVAYALDKKVSMIANFTEDWNEFELSDPNYKRITNKSVCNGCFNKFNTELDFTGEWYDCPLHKNTEREFECHTSITPSMVFDEIKEWLI